MSIKILQTTIILFRGLQIGAGKQNKERAIGLERRITGNLEEGFWVQYYECGKLMANGKGKTILEAGDMAKRMFESKPQDNRNKKHERFEP